MNALNRLSIRTRLYFGTVFSLILLVVIGAMGYLALERTRTTLEVLFTQRVQTLTDMSELRTGLSAQSQPNHKQPQHSQHPQQQTRALAQRLYRTDQAGVLLGQFGQSLGHLGLRLGLTVQLHLRSDQSVFEFTQTGQCLTGHIKVGGA